jgi:hypothetical protein
VYRTTAAYGHFGQCYQLLDLIGEEHIYPTNRHAVAAYRREQGEPGPDASPASP